MPSNIDPDFPPFDLIGKVVRIVLKDGSALEAPLVEALYGKNYVVVGMAMGGGLFGVRYSEMASLEPLR